MFKRTWSQFNLSRAVVLDWISCQPMQQRVFKLNMPWCHSNEFEVMLFMLQFSGFSNFHACFIKWGMWIVNATGKAILISIFFLLLFPLWESEKWGLITKVCWIINLIYQNWKTLHRTCIDEMYFNISVAQNKRLSRVSCW